MLNRAVSRRAVLKGAGVTGATISNGDGDTRIILCSLYLLFGIAMIAMSFNLVQEQVIHNVRELGLAMGIIKDEDEDEDDY